MKTKVTKVVSIDCGVRLRPEDQEQLRRVAILEVYGDRPTPEEVTERIKDADVAIFDWTPMTTAVIAQAEKLKLICLAGTGYQGRVDLDAAREKNITVCNVPDYASDTVAEFAIGLMIAAVHRIVEADRSVHSGEWDPSRFKGTTLSGKTLGVIGIGRIGNKVTQKTHALDMTVLTARSTTPRNQFEKLLEASDVISIHVPLTTTTRNLIGPAEFKIMKDGVVIINTSRGGVLDMDALLDNLRSGKVFAAGLDVFPEEPLPPEHPVRLHQNVITTPHIASHTEEAERRLSQTINDNIIHFLNGDPINVVNDR